MSINLIEERYVENPKEFLIEVLNEAHEIYATRESKLIYMKESVIVESMRVTGVFEDSNIKIMKSSGVLPYEAKTVYELLRSPEGFALLDPYCDPNDHKKEPIETFSVDHFKMEVATAHTKSRFMPQTEFLVLNVFDDQNYEFVSKSILHKDKPGGSYYCIECEQKNRSLNSMGFKVIPLDEGNCELLVFNYADMCLKKTNGFLYNLINKHYFYPLYKRIEKRLG